MGVYSKTMGGAGRRAKRGCIQTSRAGEGEGREHGTKRSSTGASRRGARQQPTAHARLGWVRLIGWCRPLAGPRRLRLARSSLIRRDASQCGRSLRSHLRVPMRALATDGGAARSPQLSRHDGRTDSSRWRGFAAREPSERDFASICLVAERDTADATPRAARDGGKTARTTRGGRARDRARRDRPTVGSRCHFCFVHTLLFCLYCGTRLRARNTAGKSL